MSQFPIQFSAPDPVPTKDWKQHAAQLNVQLRKSFLAASNAFAQLAQTGVGVTPEALNAALAAEQARADAAYDPLGAASAAEVSAKAYADFVVSTLVPQTFIAIYSALSANKFVGTRGDGVLDGSLVLGEAVGVPAGATYFLPADKVWQLKDSVEISGDLILEGDLVIF